jgi:hypothetical protein
MDRTCADNSQIPQAQPYGALRQAARAHSGASIIQTISVDYLTIEPPFFEADLPVNTRVGHLGPFAGIQAQCAIDLWSAPSIFEINSAIQSGQLNDVAGAGVTIVIRYAPQIPSGAFICLWIDCEWNPLREVFTEAFTRIIRSRRSRARSRHAPAIFLSRQLIVPHILIHAASATVRDVPESAHSERVHIANSHDSVE